MNQCKWARQQRWDFSFLFCFSRLAVAGPPLIIDIFEKFWQTDEKDGPAWFIFGGEERQTRTDFLLLWLLWVKGGSRSVQMQGFLVHNTPCCFSSSSSILTSSYIQEKQTYKPKVYERYKSPVHCCNWATKTKNGDPCQMSIHSWWSWSKIKEKYVIWKKSQLTIKVTSKHRPIFFSPNFKT